MTVLLAALVRYITWVGIIMGWDRGGGKRDEERMERGAGNVERHRSRGGRG